MSVSKAVSTVPFVSHPIDDVFMAVFVMVSPGPLLPLSLHIAEERSCVNMDDEDEELSFLT